MTARTVPLQLPALAGLVVLDAAELDPVAAAAELLRSAPLPPLMAAGIMDAQNLLRHYLLLHDVSSDVSAAQ